MLAEQSIRDVLKLKSNSEKWKVKISKYAISSRANKRTVFTQLSFCWSTSFFALFERQFLWNVFLHFWHLS
jgi:hypothetical protein